LKDNKPLITYSVSNNNLVKSSFFQKGVLRVSFNTKGSFVHLGTHEVAQSIKNLDLSPKPFMQSYYLERMARLDLGEIVETGVNPLDGYMGGNTPGKHAVQYDGPGQ